MLHKCQRERERASKCLAEQAFSWVPELTQILTLGESFNLFMLILLISKINLMMAAPPNHFDSQMKAFIKVHRIAINWAIIIFIIEQIKRTKL